MDLEDKVELKVGKKYELNNGDVVTMESCDYVQGATFLSSEGNLYFEDGTFGYGDHCRCEPLNVKRCLDVTRITVGNTYTDGHGSQWECIFVRDGIAWMTTGSAAYQWDAETGCAKSLGGGEYNIVFQERRKGSVEYVNGVPQWDTWLEDE